MPNNDKDKPATEMLNTRKRQRENGSQTDEDTPAGGHCCDASKMAEINAKLDKILQVMAEFDAVKTRMTQREEENKQLKLAAENTAVEIVDLKATTVYAYSGLETSNQELDSLREEVINLKRRNIKLEAYTRRENIKIFGIEDERGESNTRTEELVRIMMREKMNIPEEDVDGFHFERVHRIPTRQDRTRSSKPRPIIVKFSFYKDKEYMWSFVKNLKGSGVGIANDFPKEIDEIHQKLYPVLKEAKKTGQRASFKIDKLIISGQVYRGVETENLPHYALIMNS